MNSSILNGELVASKTIFKQEGSNLQRHMQYTFTYDDQNRLISKEASKWSYTTFNIMNSQDQMRVYKEMQEKGWLGFAKTYRASESGAITFK